MPPLSDDLPHGSAAADLPSEREVTAWLQRWGYGDGDALNAILPEIYHDLRQVGRRVLARERADHTLSTTALVHEAYLRLLGQRRLDARNRQEFFAIAGLTMRRVLVDHARRHRRRKRGGELQRIPLENAETWLDSGQLEEAEALNDALDRLAEVDPRSALIVQHRFFVGLTVEQVAELLEVSDRTVKRDWAMAKAWLRREVRTTAGGGP